MNPLGSGSRPPETTRSMTTGCSSIVRRVPTVRVTRTPRADTTTHRAATPASTIRPTPGT